MKKAIVAKKLGMTQVFSEKGTMVPVTVLEAGPCIVVQKKTNENDGYTALQVGFGNVKEKALNKPQKGHFAKAGTEPRKVLREVKLDNADQLEVGNVIKADIFAPGDRVDVSGISKGKGFQGAIKRHNQGRGPMSHGSKYHRGLGALSAGSSPAEVRKGRPMPGHMGSEKITIQNLEVVRADGEKNLILIKGAVPGIKGTILMIRDSVKA